VPAIRACEPIGCAVASNSCVPAEQSCRRPRGNKRRGTRRERTGVVSNLKDLTVRIRLTGRCRLGEVAVSVAATSVDAATPRRASLVSSVFVKRTCVRTPNCASISLSQGTSVGGRTGWIRSCRNERSWIFCAGCPQSGKAAFPDVRLQCARRSVGRTSARAITRNRPLLLLNSTKKRI
jgi:hypothetical protein